MVAIQADGTQTLNIRVSLRDIAPEDALFEMYKALYSYGTPDQATALTDGLAGLEDRIVEWREENG